MFYYKKDDKISAKPQKNPQKTPIQRSYRCLPSEAPQGHATQMQGEE